MKSGSGRMLLVHVAEALERRNRPTFDRILSERTSRGNLYASRRADDLHAASQIGSTGIFLEVKLSAISVDARSRFLLEFFGYSPADLEIVFEHPSSPSLATADGPDPVPMERRVIRKGRQKPTGIRLWGDYQEVTFWKDVLVRVVTALYRRHPTTFDRVLGLRGRKRPWISDDAGEFLNPRQIGSSAYYLETNLSASDIRKRSIAFMAEFSHSSSDLEILYD